jgi:cysteine rich repeat protein
MLAVAFVLLTAPPAMAQGMAVRQACRAELQQHCAEVEPGDGRLRACVEEHFSAFSETCKQALLSSVALVRACKADVQRTCPDVQPGGGRIQVCMKDHFTEYSKRCKQAIVTAKFGTR